MEKSLLKSLEMEISQFESSRMAEEIMVEEFAG